MASAPDLKMETPPEDTEEDAGEAKEFIWVDRSRPYLAILDGSNSRLFPDLERYHQPDNRAATGGTLFDTGPSSQKFDLATCFENQITLSFDDHLDKAKCLDVKCEGNVEGVGPCQGCLEPGPKKSATLCPHEPEPCPGFTLGTLPNCEMEHVTEIPCNTLVSLEKMLCQVDGTTPKYPQTCGHNWDWEVTLDCWQAGLLSQVEVNLLCRRPCSGTILECGHQCTGTCGTCFQGKMHQRCLEPCRKFLICGHKCGSSCSLEACPPCNLPCERKCVHKNCAMICGKPCQWECKEECVYACQHGRCSKTCNEICDKEGCQEACDKLLECGHACVGFCGEVCPPYCRYCDKEMLERGALYSLGEIGEEDKFIYLEVCGHAVESVAMTKWMKVTPEDKEIVPKCCPICRRRLGWMHRFSGIMTQNWEAVEAVKTATFGKEEDVATLLKYVEISLQEERERVWVTREVTFFPEMLIHVGKLFRGQQRNNLSKRVADFVGWFVEEWEFAQELINRTKGLPEFHEDVGKLSGWWRELYEFICSREWPLTAPELTAYYAEKDRLRNITKLYQAAFKLFQKDEDMFVRLLMVDGIPRRKFVEEWEFAQELINRTKGLPEFHEDVGKLSGWWRELYEFICTREWPLTAQELTAYYAEKDRLRNITKLYQAACKLFQKDEDMFVRLLMVDGIPRRKFVEANDCLKSGDKAVRAKFEKRLKEFMRQINVKITEPREKLEEIVKSFGPRTGRWFKCENGHPYVITECGGATVVGRCPECKAKIGGTDHRVLSSNALAVEMDGAVETAWEQVERENLMFLF